MLEAVAAEYLPGRHLTTAFDPIGFGTTITPATLGMFVTDYTVISRDLTIDAPADAIAEHVVSFPQVAGVVAVGGDRPQHGSYVLGTRQRCRRCV